VQVVGRQRSGGHGSPPLQKIPFAIFASSREAIPNLTGAFHSLGIGPQLGNWLFPVVVI
jgi:hypothetical protein